MKPGNANKLAAVVLVCVMMAGGGTLSLCLAQPPPNDHFTNAIPLYGNSVTFTGTLVNATSENVPCPWCVGCGCYTFKPAVWWSWTSSNSTQVVIDLLQQSGAQDAWFVASTGTSTNSLTDLDVNELDSVPNRYLAFSATPGVNYHIRAQGQADSFTLRLTATNAPLILSPPQDQTVPRNASAFFAVTAAGLELPRPDIYPRRQHLDYQWRFEGNALPDATEAALLVHCVSPANAGGYSVVVSNLTGATISAVAYLTVTGSNALPTLTAVNSPNTNFFLLTVAGEAGRQYQIESRTNHSQFANWPNEYFILTNITSTSMFSVNKMDTQRFYRPSLDPEICIARMKALDRAIKLFAIEAKKGEGDVICCDITPYLKMNGIACPSGVPYDYSYIPNAPLGRPKCKVVPSVHVLPPP